jgi:hypothetical protein
MRQQFNTLQFFDFLKSFLPRVDERYLAEVKRAFGSLAWILFEENRTHFL